MGLISSNASKSVEMWLAIGGVIFLAFIWLQRKCWLFVWRLNGWRGILQQPGLWALLIVSLDQKKILDRVCKYRKLFVRPLAIIVGDRVLLYVDDPETMEAVFNAPECLDKTFLQEGFFARKGLLHAEGEKWKIRRKQLNPAFSHSTMLSFFGIFNTVGERLLRKFELDIGPDAFAQFKDVEDLVSRAVLEVSCLTIMGVETNFIASDAFCIARTYKRLLEISALRIIRPWLQIDSLFRLLDRFCYESLMSSNKLVEQFVSNVCEIVQCKHEEWLRRKSRRTTTMISSTHQRQQVVGKHDEHHQPGVGDGVDDNAGMGSSPRGKESYIGKGSGDIGNFFMATKSTILQQPMASSVTEAGQDESTTNTTNATTPKRIFIEQIFHLALMGEMTLQDIIDESHSMILVSFETVSNSIIIALLCLAVHRRCQDKLRHEINETFANNENRSDVTVAHPQLQQMQYLDAIVNESLRLLTTVPMNLRHVSKDFQLRVGGKRRDQKATSVMVPQKTVIVLDAFNMQRDKAHWGPKAAKFEPERFILMEQHQYEQQREEQPSYARRHPYAFVPFSKGLRTCIGQRYSIYLMKVLLVKLISTYEFQTTIKLEELRYIDGISLKFQNADDIKFRISRIRKN